MPASSRLHQHQFSELLSSFTPNWFAVTMGTGVLALALGQLPWGLPGQSEIAAALWLLNLALFGSFALLYAGQWLFHPRQAYAVFDDPVMSMFLGTIPMGLATIVNGFLVFGTVLWGDVAVRIAAALWWVDVALAVGCAWVVPYTMFTRQKHELPAMTAVWLLPLVAAEVASAAGGLLLRHEPAGLEAERILVVSYGLCGMSVLPALGVLAILFLRMTLHKLPKSEMAATSCLSLGPIGTAALSLVLLGDQAARVLTGTALAPIAAQCRVFGLLSALILWGGGAWWFGVAALVTLRYLRQGITFNMGWWGFTFPLGVYCLATLALAHETGLSFLQTTGSALVILLVGVWVIVARGTLLFLFGKVRSTPVRMDFGREVDSSYGR